MVECSPATRAARVRFPADALVLVHFGPVTVEGVYQHFKKLANFARSVTCVVVLRKIVF